VRFCFCYSDWWDAYRYETPVLYVMMDGQEYLLPRIVLGGMVVYGTVIYNDPSAEADSSTAQTKDPKIGANPYKGLLAFQEADGDILGLHENIDYCELLSPGTEAKDNL
jgi:hypothetical protein